MIKIIRKIIRKIKEILSIIGFIMNNVYELITFRHWYYKNKYDCIPFTDDLLKQYYLLSDIQKFKLLKEALQRKTNLYTYH